MDFIVSFLVLFSIIWTWVVFLTSRKSKARKSARIPPGPFPLPIIGNILELGPKPHRSLAKLSQKYGPLMSLRLGSKKTVVVSSSAIAKTVLQTHDFTFSSRSIPGAAEALKHDEFSMVWLPVENQWRKLRKICKEHMFSVSRLDASQGLRQEKLEKLHGYVEECRRTGRAVNVGEAAFITSLNLMSATLFSREFGSFDSESTQDMKDLVWGVMEFVGKPNIADYFPVLKSSDPHGILKQTEIYFGKLFEIFDEIIDEKLKTRASGGNDEKKDLVEALLDLNQKDDPEISRDHIKHLLLDLFVAGTDTTSGTVEWAMTELIRQPKKMSRIRDELRDVIGENGQIQESDISRLPYLQAVVKETFRLHPAAPFLVPHEAKEDIEINGYIIPKNTQVLVNVWASGRDPNTWPDVEMFVPERFLDRKEIDFKGKDFELIPFGAGRRICPGLPLANRTVHLMLATLIKDFGWKIENGQKGEDLDMEERFGLTLQKAIPLKLFPIHP